MNTSALARERVLQYIDGLCGETLHSKRVLSLANAVSGCLKRASLAVQLIGLGLADLGSLKSKHAVKQVDRLVSNEGLDVDHLLKSWVPFCVGSRPDILVALDWTEFDHDGHSTLALNLVTRHGRATPLMWKTVRTAELAGQRNGHEDDLLSRFRDALPAGVSVTVLADRGFGDQKLYAHLETLGFGYVIRFRQNILVTNAEGETRPASAWVPSNGHARRLSDAFVTSDRFPIRGVVVVRQRGMKEAWCLAVSSPDMSARLAVSAYQKRFSIEENFRNTKDPHFGMGMHQLRIGRPDRRDRLLLISALAVALLTLLGAAGEATGLDMCYKANTAKTRTHSLFRQGAMYFGSLPTMRDAWAGPLLEKFEALLDEHMVTQEVFSVL